MYVADTIAAIATAPGAGAIGIVRISGPRAAEILARLQRSSSPPPSHHLRLAHLFDERGELLDQALCVLMRGPSSYTGEDIVELHCHGSATVLKRVLAAALRLGARLAEPGELTRRAFLNGRLDLAQAEAVDDLIRAPSSGQASLALQQLTGTLSAELAQIRSTLIDLKSLLEVQIDFAEEDVAVDTVELEALADSAASRLAKLVASYQYGKLLRDGARVAIVGRPNVGKSSLLNALVGEERVIVTPIAGTTRDVIEESIEINGLRIVLLDTAGLRSHADADAIELLGMERTRAQLAIADVALIVLDSSQPLTDEDRAVLDAAAEVRSLVVWNKADLPPASARLERDLSTVRISALDHSGLDDLREALAALLIQTPPDSKVLISHERHRDALSKAWRATQSAGAAIAQAVPPDLIAVDVQEALDQIAEITGVITTEDVLDRIFSRFCLGK